MQTANPTYIHEENTDERHTILNEELTNERNN